MSIVNPWKFVIKISNNKYVGTPLHIWQFQQYTMYLWSVDIDVCEPVPIYHQWCISKWWFFHTPYNLKIMTFYLKGGKWDCHIYKTTFMVNESKTFTLTLYWFLLKPTYSLFYILFRYYINENCNPPTYKYYNSTMRNKISRQKVISWYLIYTSFLNHSKVREFIWGTTAESTLQNDHNEVQSR